MRASQAQVAEKLGIRQPSYAAWERRTVALSHERIEQLADILGVKAGDFFRVKETSAKRGGPVGRSKRAFEVVSKLPRSPQQKIPRRRRGTRRQGFVTSAGGLGPAQGEATPNRRSGHEA